MPLERNATIRSPGPTPCCLSPFATRWILRSRSRYASRSPPQINAILSGWRTACARRIVSSRMSQPSNYPESRILDVVGKTVPRHDDALSDRDRVRIRVQDVAENPHAFVELHRCDRKWQPAIQARPGNADHRAGVNRALARYFAPFQIPAAGEDAHRARIVLKPSGVLAELQHKLASLSTIPKRLGVNVNRRFRDRASQ